MKPLYTFLKRNWLFIKTFSSFLEQPLKHPHSRIRFSSFMLVIKTTIAAFKVMCKHVVLSLNAALKTKLVGVYMLEMTRWWKYSFRPVWRGWNRHNQTINLNLDNYNQHFYLVDDFDTQDLQEEFGWYDMVLAVRDPQDHHRWRSLSASHRCHLYGIRIKPPVIPAVLRVIF